MNIINNSVRPAKFMTIGYFEPWNVKGRKRLHMAKTAIPFEKFVDITLEYGPKAVWNAEY